MATLLSSGNYGSTSASALIKSAGSLQTSLNAYNDYIQKANFDQNPTNQAYADYVKYLQGRISSESNFGTPTAMLKAAELTTAITTAYKSNTTFNLNIISTQMLTSGATDQAKLDYLSGTVLNNSVVRSDPALFQKYMMQAYNLQQSIEYHAQAEATAQATQQKLDVAAQRRGYDDANSELDAQFKLVKDSFAEGKINTSDMQQNIKGYLDTLKSQGIQLPKGATTDAPILRLGYDIAKVQYYGLVKDATAVSDPETSDVYNNKATDIINSQNFAQDLANAYAPSNLYTPNVSESGNVSNSRNATTGYTHEIIKTPYGNYTVNVPQTSGAAVNKTDTRGKVGTTNVFNSMGMSVVKANSDGSYDVQVSSDKAPNWLKKAGDITPGMRITMVPTSQGFQFTTGIEGNSYGISFGNKGLPALYRQSTNGTWSEVGGAYGYNPKSSGSIGNAVNPPHGFARVLGAAEQAAPQIHAIINQFKSAPHGPTMTQRAGGGFNFVNAQGKAISAATYATLTGQDFRALLTTMSTRGDAGAKQALGFVGSDMKYDPTKIGAGGNANIYNALTWGAEPNARTYAPNTSGGSLSLPSGLKLGK